MESLVSMPSRAFLLFGPLAEGALVAAVLVLVSMPSRAFLLFGLEDGVYEKGAGTLRFNALAGIFAFRTHLRGDKMDKKRMIGFNALAGIFAFRTDNLLPQEKRGIHCFNALAGIFAFRTGKECPERVIVRIVSMPSRAFLLFGLL